MIGQVGELAQRPVLHGDVPGRAEQPGRFTAGVGEHLAVTLEDPFLPVLTGEDPVGERERPELAHRRGQRRLEQGDVVGVQHGAEAGEAQPSARRQTEQHQQRLGQFDDVVAHVPEPGAHPGHGLHPGQPPGGRGRSEIHAVRIVSPGFVTDLVQQRRTGRVEPAAADLPPAGAAARRRPSHRGTPGSGPNLGEHAERSGRSAPHGSLPPDEHLRGGVAPRDNSVSQHNQAHRRALCGFPCCHLRDPRCPSNRKDEPHQPARWHHSVHVVPLCDGRHQTVGTASDRLVKRRSRRLLETTNTELSAMAAPASIGFSSPATASGSAT